MVMSATPDLAVVLDSSVLSGSRRVRYSMASPSRSLIRQAVPAAQLFLAQGVSGWLLPKG